MHRSTFLSIQPAATLILSVDWGLAIGNTATFGTKPVAWLDVTLNSATTPTSVDLANGKSYEAPHGLKLLDICVTVANAAGFDAYFEPGVHNNLSTDQGIGFAKVTGRRGPAIPDGYYRTACDAWAIPEFATTAVYAIGYSKIGGTAGETLYKIDLPSNWLGTKPPQARISNLACGDTNRGRVCKQALVPCQSGFVG